MKKTKTIKQTNKIANQVPVAGTESGNLGKRVRPLPSHNSLPIGWHLSRNFFSERDFFCFLLDLGFYICGLTLAFQWWVESKPVQCWQLSPEIREQGKEKRSVYWASIKSAVPLFMKKKKRKNHSDSAVRTTLYSTINSTTRKYCSVALEFQTQNNLVQHCTLHQNRLFSRSSL